MSVSVSHIISCLLCDAQKAHSVCLLQARGSAGWTPDKTSVGQAVKTLESLIKQLDSLLPYLSVAINAVNLLNSGAGFHHLLHCAVCATLTVLWSFPCATPSSWRNTHFTYSIHFTHIMVQYPIHNSIEKNWSNCTLCGTSFDLRHTF